MKQCSFRLCVFSAYVHYILLNLAESKMKKFIIYMQNTVVTLSNFFFFYFPEMQINKINNQTKLR